MNDLTPDITAAGVTATSVAALSRATTMPEATAAAPTEARPRRGRKPGETPAKRLERLQRAVVEAKQAAREAERRKFAVVGEAVLAEAEADGAFRVRVVEILRRRVTAAGAKTDIASLLTG